MASTARAVVNRGAATVLAFASVEIAAFDHPRDMTIMLDGAHVQTLRVPEQRGTRVVGPLRLSPGMHELAFHAAAAPTLANDVLKNGDGRPLSFAFGACNGRRGGRDRGGSSGSPASGLPRFWRCRAKFPDRGGAAR